MSFFWARSVLTALPAAETFLYTVSDPNLDANLDT